MTFLSTLATPNLASRPWESQRVMLSEPSNNWKSSVMSRLEDLLRLPEGWDGYNAFPVSFSNAFFACNMLESICSPETSAPQIVPGVAGDLQIEWHTHQGDIELWVRGPNDVHAYYSTGEDEEEELVLATDFSKIAQWVTEVMEPNIAFAAAA